MKVDRAEIARDLMGLGSVPFLVLVVVRVTMAGNYLELFHIVTAALLFIILKMAFPRFHFHSATIVILIVFTSMFYDDNYYTGFATATGLLAIYGFVKYLGKDNVYRSVAAGLLCSLASYLISLPLDISNV